MSFQYTILGNQCEPKTRGALTSNGKYILPLSSIYYKPYTPMMYYPGHDNMYSLSADKLFGSNIDPEEIKAYNVGNHDYHQIKSKGCTSCQTMK